MILSNKTLDSLKLAPKNKRIRILAASRAINHLLPENESSKIIIRDIDSLRNWSVLSIFGAFVNLGASLRLSSISRERKILEYQNLFFCIFENNFYFFSEMNSIRKRDYDADLERLKTFIDSYHNNDPETGKKGKIWEF